jgi:hypothetical protein
MPSSWHLWSSRIGVVFQQHWDELGTTGI